MKLEKNLKEIRNRWQVKVAIGGFAASMNIRVKRNHTWCNGSMSNKQRQHTFSVHSIISHWLKQCHEQQSVGTISNLLTVELLRREVSDLMLDTKNGENMRISCPFYNWKRFFTAFDKHKKSKEKCFARRDCPLWQMLSYYHNNHPRLATMYALLFSRHRVQS